MGHFVPGAFLTPEGPGGPGLAGFPILLPTLAAPQALFGVNTEIQGDKGRAIKEAQHEVLKPQEGFPDHMVEDIGDVFEAPTDPSVGDVVEDERRHVCHDRVGIGQRLKSLGDPVQNLSPWHLLVVFQAINSVLFHRRDLLEFTVVQTMDAVRQQQRQHNHERQNVRYPVSVLFRESRLPDTMRTMGSDADRSQVAA